MSSIRPGRRFDKAVSNEEWPVLHTFKERVSRETHMPGMKKYSERINGLAGNVTRVSS